MQDVIIPINTQSAEELAALVQQLAPELTYVKDLNVDSPSYRTLLVTRQGEERVLKVRRISGNTWDSTYFYYEVHALRRAAERQLSCVVRLVGEYKTRHYHAILKTYAKGTPCNDLDPERLIETPAFVKKLDALYMKLHLAGIASIHYQPNKVVMAPDGELILVNLDTCIVNTEMGVQRFSQEMRADSRFINRIEKRARAVAG